VPKQKILLVDDTRLILELEKSFLKFSHVDVVTAGNGAEALEVIRQGVPDLIFMDLNMPVMDGLTCCRKLKDDPFLCSIPVVMLTTAGREEDRVRGREAGCDDFLTKPIDRREFLEMARKYTESVDRRLLRLPCLMPLLVMVEGAPVAAHGMDISNGGLYVASLEQVEAQQTVTVAFYLPAAKPQLVEVSGRIAWVNEEGKRVKQTLPPGFGVEFQQVSEEQMALIEAFLEAEAVDHSGGL
jgi:two-component system, cell cycle response regulator